MFWFMNRNSKLIVDLLFIKCQLEFIRGLVQLSIEKLCMDIVDISKDEHLFSHLIDETLSFEQELRDNLGYPSSLPSAITVLTQAQYLTKWIAIEERCEYREGFMARA